MKRLCVKCGNNPATVYERGHGARKTHCYQCAYAASDQRRRAMHEYAMQQAVERGEYDSSGNWIPPHLRQ